MSRDYPDPLELDELHAEDQFVADLFGVYAHRRDNALMPQAHHLLWCAAQRSPSARRSLRTVIGLYEAARTNKR